MESDFPRYTVDIERLVRGRNRLCLIAPADCRVRLNGVVWLTAGQEHGTGAAICRVVAKQGRAAWTLSDLAVDEGKDQIHALFEQTKRSMSWCSSKERDMARGESKNSMKNLCDENKAKKMTRKCVFSLHWS